MSFQEQIMSKDRFPSLFFFFLSQMEAIVFIILQIFFTRELPFFHIASSFKIPTIQPKAYVRGARIQHLKRKKKNLFNSIKDKSKSKIQVADKVTGDVTTFRFQDQSENWIVKNHIL